MQNSVIAEGKTTNEAIEKGLAILKVSKDMVEIKVLENEEKRSFFSILTPRIVKVELTLKDEIKRKLEEKNAAKLVNKNEEKHINIQNKEIKKVIAKLDEFLNEFFYKLNIQVDKKIEVRDDYIYISINGENLNFLIGYRGETLNAMQTILSSIASRVSIEKIKIVLDIENYREKRKVVLEELAEKISKTLVKNRKKIELEPMSAYERKIIHTKLQNNSKVKTYSVGEEPNRRIIVDLK